MDEESFFDRIDRLLSPETPAEMGATFAAESTPYLGTGMDVGNFLMGIRNRDVSRAGISALAALLPFVGAGTLRRVGEGVAKKLKPSGIKSIKSRDFYLPVEFFDEEYPSLYGAEPVWDAMPDGRPLWPELDPRGNVRKKRHHTVEYTNPDQLDDYGYLPKTSEFDFFTYPGESVRRSRPGSLDQLEIFPEINLAVDIPDTGTKVGASGIRSLGRAAIEDYEKGVGGLYRVSELYGPRITGTRGHLAGTDDVHYMVLPRSFFFK
jgi:hypothetical protein